MIKHAWTVICQKSIIDQDTNNISLDVLEQIEAKIPPLPEEAKGIVLPMQIEVTSLWYREKPEQGTHGNGRLRVEAPNKKEVASANIDIDLNNNGRVRTRIRLDGLPVLKNISGYFFFITEIESSGKWLEVARIPLEFKILP